MDRNDINITIYGLTGCGKSHLLYQIKQFLKEKGYNVDQEMNHDFSREEIFDEKMSKFPEAATEMLKGKRIHIKEDIVQKNIKSSAGLWYDYHNNLFDMREINRPCIRITEEDPYGEEDWDN